ncbi:MAG: hypothetical protein ABI674_07515 [Spartobacteria bacterium]
MTKTIMCLTMLASALGAASLLAQEGATTAAGTVTLNKKSYPLKRALAYETKIDDEDGIAVVLSGPPVTSEMLQKARESEKEGNDPDFKRPFLRLLFDKTGKLKYWGAAAGGSMLGRRSGEATGELQVQGGRVKGKASQPTETEGMFPSGFEASFDVALLKVGQSLPASSIRRYGPAANVKPTVSGIFRGNGKEAKIAFVSARWVEPFDGKPGIELIFTEKDHSTVKNPDMDAAFGKLGSALLISLFEDGQIYSCQVVHRAHQKQGFSSIGNIEATEFSYEDGKVEGELTTSGQVETFGETWEVKLKFVAPLGEIPKQFQVVETKVTEKPATSETSEAEDDAGVPEIAKSGEAKPAGAQLKAKDLALTKDAAGVEYKALVEQLAFKSKSNVKSVCAELAAALKAQGWENDGMDMVNPASSILKRKRGEAALTIFVKPDASGSEVKMMTEGLSWD